MPSDQVQEVGGKPSSGINPKYTAKDLRFFIGRIPPIVRHSFI